MAMAKEQDDAPVTEVAAEAQPPEPTFLRDVAKLATLAEEAIHELRTITHKDTFKFSDLGYLFPQKVDSVDHLIRVETVVGDYLAQTAIGGLSRRKDFLSGTPIECNTSTFPPSVTAWMKEVYTPRKEEIDAKVEALITDISDYANLRARDLAFELGEKATDTDRFFSLSGKPHLGLDALLAGDIAELKTRLYQTELPRPENLSQLYELCFNSEVEKRGWLDLEDDKLIEALAQENVPLEMFQKYYPEREIKLPEKDKRRTGIKFIDKIIELVGGNPAAGRSRTEDAGSQRSSQILILDPASAENNAVKTQEQWIVYWNNIRDGRRFASMADYYPVFKQLTDAIRSGSEEEKHQANELIDSLRKDFQENYLLTSTRVIYQPDSLEAKIIHGYGASNLQLTSERSLVVPLYWDTPIAEAYGTDEGLTYLQALLQTGDSGPVIAERLSAVSGYSQQNIRLWTPPLQSNPWLTRSQLANRAVGLDFGSRRFHLDAGGRPVGDRYRSRGVRSEK